MADFYPVLSRAIAGLQDQGPEARRAVYDRARQVLVAQLRNVDPPISESDITRQRLALDDVIARIEREHHAALSRREQAEAAEPAAPPAYAPTPLPEPEPPGAALATPAAADPAADEPASEAAGWPPPGDRSIPDRQGQERLAKDRPRLDIAPLPSRPRSLRGLITAGGIAVGVAVIAVTAYFVNQDSPSVPIVAQVPSGTAAAPTGGPKINERVGAEPGSSTPAPSLPAPGAAQQPGAPAATGQTAAPAASQPAGRSDIAVAQRAVLYVETGEANAQPRMVVGRVAWRVEAQNAGQGQPLETVVRADVEIAEAGLNLLFTIRRNTDAAFPASHIIGMRFARTADDGNGAVREAGVPQFKAEEGERGAPLSAITSVLGENLFVAATSRVPVEVERNVELIRTRNWIDIPVRFASGKRGIIAFEKGLSGDQRIAEGFAAWR